MGRLLFQHKNQDIHYITQERKRKTTMCRLGSQTDMGYLLKHLKLKFLENR